jgi:hypothetical protein
MAWYGDAHRLRYAGQMSGEAPQVRVCEKFSMLSLYLYPINRIIDVQTMIAAA